VGDSLSVDNDDFTHNGRFEDFREMRESLFDKLSHPLQIDKSNKMSADTYKANEAKRERTRQRVEEATISLLDSGIKVTAYSVAKVSGLSFNTVKKYLDAQRPPAPLPKKGKASITNKEALSLIGQSTRHSDNDVKLLKEVFTLSGAAVTDTAREIGFSHASVLTNIVTDKKGIGRASRELLKAYLQNRGK